MKLKTLRLRPALLRLFIQAVFAAFCLSIGWRFFLFIQWARGMNPEFVPRPPSVEGFLPISALLGLKRLLVTGQWDSVHPAGLAILLAALLMSWLFRKGFCAYICPVGFISSLVAKLGRRIGLGRTPFRWIALVLQGAKYLVLGFFLYSVFWAMNMRAVERFMKTPYNITADARMLEFFLAPSSLCVGVLVGLVAASLLWRNFWCRFLCPYGALLGIVAFFSPFAIRREVEHCIGCEKCSRVCPTGIPVAQRTSVGTAECMGCTECVGVCPVPDCLHVSAGKHPVPFWVLGAGCVGMLLLVWAVAQGAGYWDADLPLDMLRRMYSMPRQGF